jgi:RHS repeat-associated protein
VNLNSYPQMLPVAAREPKRQPMRKPHIHSARTRLASLVSLIVILLVPSCLFAQGEDNPTGVTGIYNGNVTTAGSYDPYTHNAHRVVDDIVVPGSVGAYPLKWTRYYNSRHEGLGYDGCWDGWSFSYGYYWPSSGVTLPDGTVINPDSDSFSGGLEYSFDNTTSTSTLLLPDGGKVRFSNPMQVIDPYGQITTIDFDSHGRRTRVTEPGGRYLQINWDHPAGDIWANSVIQSVYAYSGPAGSPDDHVTQWVSYGWGGVQSGQNSYPGLSDVDYHDGTGALNTYTVIGGKPTNKRPGLIEADDVRYNGPMRQIGYNPDTKGAITQETKPSGEVVSTIGSSISNPCFETRGDGATRRFTYGNGISAVSGTRGKLLNYTDFEGHTTTLTYEPDSHSVSWGFINSVTDANGHATTYTRQANSWGIKTITHPDGSHIDQTYWPSNSESSPYYLASRTDELGHTTTYTRDSNNRITRKDYASDNQTPASYEIFEYNSFGQVTKHRLKNGAYQHFQYSSDNRGLLLAKWNPTSNSAPLDSDPKTTFTYYTSGPWTDRVQTETDPRGNTTTYEYDFGFDTNGNNTSAPAGRGLVTKITHADNTYQLFVYNKYGDKMWEENENRERTIYSYDNYGRVLTVTNPLNKIVATNTYKPTNGTNTSPYVHTTNCNDTSTTATGIVTTNVYDANFRKTSSTVGSSTTAFVYDLYGTITSIGNLVAVTDPNGHTTTTDYDTRNRKWHVTDALNHMTTFGYDAASNVITITRPDLSVETKTYDALNRVLTDTVPKDGPAALPTEFITTTFVYNPSGSLYSVKDGKDQITTFEYDASDLKTKMTYPNGTDYQSWTYDAAKNLIARRTVNGVSQLFSYDSRNREFAMAWSNGADWANFGYDDASRMISAENPTSTITRAYDAAGHLMLDRQRLRILPLTAVSRKTHNTYPTPMPFDVALPLVGTAGVECRTGGATNDHQMVVTFPRAVTFTGTSIALGSGGTGTIANTSTSADGKTVTINLTGVTNAQTIVVTLNGVNDGITTNNVNIGMGVLWGDTTGNGFVNSADVSQTQSQSGWPVSNSNFREDVTANGFINSGDVGVVQWQSGHSLPSASPLTQPLPSSPDIDVQYAYDDDGKEKQVYVTSAGYNLNYHYDGQGRFDQIQNAGGTPLFTYTYDAASNEIDRLNNATGVHQSYGTPDQLNRMTQRDVNLGANTISHEAYGYHSQRPGLLTSVDRGTATLTRDAFAYDLTGELTSAQYDLVSSGGNWTNPQRQVGYVWDKAGNRASMTDTGGASCNYGTTILNQYWTDGANPISNGSVHEMASYQNISYAYINDTHLSSVSGMDIYGGQSTYQLSYDALGRCTVRVLNGSVSYYIYDGEKPILEYHSWSGPSAANIYGRGIDEILMRTDYTTTPIRTVYYQDDHEGNVTHLMMQVNNTPTVVESYRYDAFGKPTINGGALTTSAYGNRFLFTGREYVSQFGIYEYRNRAYHPGLGRFMSEDPKGFAAGDNNFFRYCGNDPEDHTDPMGLAAGPDSAEMRIPDYGVTEQLADNERDFEVSVDAHSSEMHDYARAEARTAAEGSRGGTMAAIGVGGRLSTDYLVYGGKWGEEDKSNLEQLWADSKNAEKLNQYASDSIEHIITPIHERGQWGISITNTRVVRPTLWDVFTGVHSNANFEKKRQGDNTGVNRMKQDAAREAGLSRAEQRLLHDIDTREMSYNEIRDIAREIKSGAITGGD